MAAANGNEVTTTITAKVTFDMPSKKSYNELNPRQKPTEFFGPVGATAVTFGAPFVAYALFFTCNEWTGCTVPPQESVWERVGAWPNAAGALWDWHAAAAYLAWYAYIVACAVLLPGEKVEGSLLRDGTRKMYKMNGLWTLLLTMGICAGVIARPGGIETFTWIYDHWVPLLSAALAMATFQAVWVYAWSFVTKELLALQGNTGNVIYDFYMGRPLNPTPPFFPSFDLKAFNEVRPGMILWLVLNISCACEQYLRLGRLTDSMVLVLLFEGIYTLDCELAEKSILNQMDITTDGFGFMLSFGDLVWVPFTFGLQARYLAFHPIDLGLAACGAIFMVEVAGQYIFRVANNEKNEFRAGKNPKNLTSMATARGTKLLTSGWWGRSRHPNYLGDWIMAWAWCLPTGFNTPITYFYVVYFGVLLVHRQTRDDQACKEKYGKDWDEYCKRVPYRIVPYLY